MKKTILTATSFICIVTLTLIGCKKDFSHGEEKNAQAFQQEIQSQSQTESSSFMDNLSVSYYGFLVFPRITDFEEYHNFIKRSTHGEIQEYLGNIGFTSIGASIYGENYFSETVTDEEAMDYVFNSDKVFQVQDVIMKPINEVNEEVKWQFLLTMIPDNLTNSSYEILADGIYDATTMNKFATNPEEENLDLLNFIKDTPNGYEETVANSSMARRPIIGRADGFCDWWYEFNPATGNNDKVVSYGCEKGPLYIIFKVDDGKDCGFGDNKCLDF